MSSSSAMGIAKAKKDGPERNKNPEALRMLLEEAQKAALADRHDPDVDGQESTTAGHEDNQQSTHDVDEDPPHPKTSNASNASHDIRKERHPEPVNTDEHGSRNVEMLDAGSEYAEDSSSDPALPATPDANTQNGKLELLEDFGNLNLGKDDMARKKKETKTGGRNSADIDWFGGKGTSQFCIFRTGPPQAPRYEYHRTNAYSVPEPKKYIYETSNRISQLHWKDEKGKKHWLYDSENIAGTVAITVAERDENRRIWVQSPHAWVKIKWKNIQKEHQKLLIGGCSWIPRADMIRLLGEKQAAIRLHFAWNVQESRYVEAMRKKGRFIDPLTFPLYTFNEVKMERERSRSVMPSSFFTSDRLPSVEPIGRNRAGVSTAATSMGVKKEEEEQYAQRTAPSHLPGETGEAFVIDRGDDARAGNKRQPKKFSMDSYLASVKKAEKWDDMSESDKDIRFTKALANYDHYKKARESMGDEEED